MTRATLSPLRRIVKDRSDRKYVAEVRADTLTLRPLRSRAGGPADVSIPWGTIYTLALLSRPAGRKRRGVSRGLLKTERGT